MSAAKAERIPARIEDYAMIGDCRSAALVSREGCIDWFCVPRFDSQACFAALLGTTGNGCWQIGPRNGVKKITRAYRDGSLTLETTFETAQGAVKLIDFMPMDGKNPTIVRIVECLRGKVPMATELVIRFDYGVSVPWVTRNEEGVLTAVAGPHMLVLRTKARLHGKDMRTVGNFTVKKGDRLTFVLAYGPSHLPSPSAIDPDAALKEANAYWSKWSSQSKCVGKWKKIADRSLITLKGLSYFPTGGMVAAVTTSLPEQWGGSRNWDYRYCWLRDATFTLLAFLNAGYIDEAHRWQLWLMRAIAGSPEQIQTLYGVAGERRLDEWEIPWLKGYRGAAPVRVGNAAAGQLQLDIYGELSDVMTQADKGGLPPAPRRRELREIMLPHLEKIWREPDEGIWEIRGEPQHFTHSKAMVWVAFDRAARGEAAVRSVPERRHLKAVANEIHADICAKALDPERGCFVQAYGSKHLDASLLLLAIVGFLPATDRRIRRTVEEIEKYLLVDGLVMRYQSESGVDGLPPGEGAFLACSFWLADNYLLQGRVKEARALFGRLVKLCNDVGLLSEEYDPREKRMLGNFPQAFSHVALVNTAINLMHADHATKKKKPRAQHVKRHRS